MRADEPPIAFRVACSICGHRWDMRNPEVSYRYMDAVWECRDESMCFERKAMAELNQEVGHDAADQGQ